MRDTPTMMLGRTPAGFARALPAGSLGATFPGSGGPNEMTQVGTFPSLDMNFITTPPGVPATANPGRVWNGGPDFSERPVGANTGLPIRNMLLSGLAATPARTLVTPSNGYRSRFVMGVLGVGLGAVPGLGGDDTVAPPTQDELSPCMNRIGSGSSSITYAQFWQGRAATLHLLGAVLAGVHGYQRNKGSLGWAAGWAALGFFAPVITTGVALVQGFGKR